jgi:hypothetical protein
MNWEGYGNRQPCHVLKYYPGICHKELRKIKILLQFEVWTLEMRG